jgi:FAD synthase
VLIPLERFRAEQPFSGLESLQAQLTLDRERTRVLLKEKKALFDR